jgi:hypothetical protein
MLWRSSTASTIYVLRQDGAWNAYPDPWREGMAEKPCALTPPAGYQQPVRGFGTLWCTHSAVRDELGWATAPERGFRGVFQIYQQGYLLGDAGSTFYTWGYGGTWQEIKP